MFVKASKTRHALDGDIVRVAVTREKTNDKRREGEVVEIIERGVTTFCGMLMATAFGIFMVPGLYSVFARMRNWTVAKVHGDKLP